MLSRPLLALLLLSFPAWAEDIPLRADVTAATLYPQGAETVRRVTVDVAAGTHRMLIPLPGQTMLPGIQVSGATLTGTALLPESGVDLEALDTQAQAAARAALTEAASETEAAEAALQAAQAKYRSADIRLRWLNTLTGNTEGSLQPAEDPDALVAMLETLAGQAAQAGADAVTADIEVRAAERVLEEARAAEEDAKAALERLRPLPEGTPVLALSLAADVSGPLNIVLDTFIPTAAWTPVYDLRLDTEAETLVLDRNVELTLNGPEVWTDVALTLSTANPNRGTDPTEPFPDAARVVAPGILRGTAEMDVPQLEARAAETFALAPEPVVVAEAQSYGLSVTYDYPLPVTLIPGAPATVSLDRLDLGLETELRAVPRRDQTAFLVATATNTTAEPILPGRATLYRDGDRIGEHAMPALASGADHQLGFGPVDTIRLSWLRLERGEGDSGIFRTSSTLREDVAFTVENTGRDPVEVLTLYALPFSEQEKVGVETRATPRPDQMDWEDRRGVAAWTLSLAPGATERVEMVFELDWPEGETLAWQP